MIKNVVSKLEKTKEFSGNVRKGMHLAHVLLLIEPGVEHRFDIGYYDPKKELMTTFLVDKECASIEVQKDQKVFKDPAHDLLPLDITKVEISYEVAQELAADCQREKYKEHVPLKEVVLLQNVKEGQVWNITYVTKTFKTLNIKVSASRPEIVSDKLVEVFQIG